MKILNKIHSVFLVLLCVYLLPNLCLADKVELINLRVNDTNPYPTILGQFGEKVILTRDNGSGKDLISTDGTASGTATILPSSADIDIDESSLGAAANGYFYFSASDSAHGKELWKTGGSQETTSLVKDINPGPMAKSSPANFTSANNFVFFSASLNYTSYLFRTDGTDTGTVKLAILNNTYFATLNNRVIFKGCLLDNSSMCGIIASDGTLTGTNLILSGDIKNSDFVYTTMNNLLYFLIFWESGSARFSTEIWSTDGSTANTKRDFVIGTSYALTYDDIIAFKGEIFYTIIYNSNPQLWKFNTSGGSSLVYAGGVGGSSFYHLKAIGDSLLFYSATFPSYFVSDGTTAGTTPVSSDRIKDLLHAVKVSDSYYFSSYDSEHGDELWRCRSINEDTCNLVVDINAGSGSSSFNTESNGEVLVVGNKLFLTATDYYNRSNLTVISAGDFCPDDPNKEDPGICGCGIGDKDTDNDGALDCQENCPLDSLKTSPGTCGCGVADSDYDHNGIIDCLQTMLSSHTPTRPSLKIVKNGLSVKMEVMNSVSWLGQYSISKPGGKGARTYTFKSNRSSTVIKKGLVTNGKVTLRYAIKGLGSMQGKSHLSPVARLTYKPIRK